MTVIETDLARQWDSIGVVPRDVLAELHKYTRHHTAVRGSRGGSAA
jgi:hypothetical protein